MAQQLKGGGGFGDEANRDGSCAEFGEGALTRFAQVDGPIVDIQIDMREQHVVVELLGVVPHRRQGFVAMIESIANALMDDLLHAIERVAIERESPEDAS